MLLNAIVVLLASMGTLVGLRTGMKFALVHELDQILSEDLEEIELALVVTGDPYLFRALSKTFLEYGNQQG